MVAIWAEPGKSELSHACSSTLGFAAIFPKTSQRNRFERDLRKTEEMHECMVTRGKNASQQHWTQNMHVEKVSGKQ